ncbi:MAG: hypothetical protein JXK94_06100 [Deltaproteobacteria bacterium]|nr:hypothetical protein [Deltaproteobacteria bacterium]
MMNLTPWMKKTLAHWEQHRLEMVERLTAEGNLEDALVHAHGKAKEEVAKRMRAGESFRTAKTAALNRWMLFLPESEVLEMF